MENPETLVTLGTQDAKKTEKTKKMSNTDPLKQVVNPGASER